MDVAQLGISVTSKGVKEAAAGLHDLAGAGQEAETSSGAAARAINEMDKGATASKMSTGGAAAAVLNLSKSQEAAAVSANKTASNLVRLNAAANDNTKSFGGVANQLKAASLQLSQTVQQVQAGGGVLQALAIQLPDIGLAFGPIGIAAGIAAGAALSYFGAVMGQADDSAKVLQQQRDLIQQVAEKWGEAYPALKAYADELERAKNASDLQAAQAAASSFVFKEVLATLDGLAARAPEISKSLRDLTSPEGVAAAQAYLTAMTNIREAIAAGKDPSDALSMATTALATIMDQTGSAAVRSYADQFTNLAARIQGASEQSQAFFMQMPDLGALGEMWGEGGKFFNSEQFEVANPPTPGRRPLIELEGLPKVRGGGAGNDSFKSSIQSIQDRTKAIQAETAAQAGLNPLVNDYGYALTKAKTSADLLAAAEKAKKTITPELNAQIEKTAEALANATAEQNRQTEAVQKARQQMEFVKNTTAGFINDLRDGLRNGEGFWESFGNAAMGVLDRITDKLLNETLDAVFKVGNAGGGGGGLFGFLGSLFGGGSNFASLPAVGPVPAVRPYASGTMSARSGLALVGEKGPELVRFKGGEEVIPNHRVMSASNQNGSSKRSGAGTSSDVRVTADVRAYVDDNGNWQAKVENISAGVSKAMVSQYDSDKGNLYQNGQAA